MTRFSPMGSGVFFGTASGFVTALASSLIHTIANKPEAIIENVLQTLLMVTPVALIFSFLGTLLLGLPIAYALRRVGFLNAFSLSVAGFVCGAALSLSGRGFEWELGILFSCAGGLAGFMFWHGYELKERVQH